MCRDCVYDECTQQAALCTGVCQTARKFLPGCCTGNRCSRCTGSSNQLYYRLALHRDAASCSVVKFLIIVVLPFSVGWFTGWVRYWNLSVESYNRQQKFADYHLFTFFCSRVKTQLFCIFLFLAIDRWISLNLAHPLVVYHCNEAAFGCNVTTLIYLFVYLFINLFIYVCIYLFTYLLLFIATVQ